MVVECRTCPVRGVRCDDCVVTAVAALPTPVVGGFEVPLDAAERSQLGSLVDKMLAARAGATLVPAHACRLCDTESCGHPQSCPVSLGTGAAVPCERANGSTGI